MTTSCGGSWQSDVLLAERCALREPSALLQCRQAYDAQLASTLRKMNLDGPTAADVLQQFWSYVLVDDGHGGPYIAKFQGRGPLGAFFKVILTRMALKSLRASKPLKLADTLDGLRQLIDPNSENADTQYAALLYQKEFRDAFHAAVGRLSDKDRQLLRSHIIEGRSIDQVAEMYGVHRATAARWIQRAKDELSRHVQRIVRSKLRLGGESYASLVALMRSRMDLSIVILSEPDFPRSGS